ncbi:MAG: Asp-tRNA(Asn)/Glu-tRNA(Gln) amidotransferase subunit GatA [Chitinophagaceae bacterium]|nr:Asp-tRNA(Asn)/Glu-tRNA(Gln) amidotransferase subunit GatA [Chitinophagaceae bacterium]
MFRYSTIKDYHNALQNGQTTCVEAVLFFIDAIRKHERLNAFLEVYETEALDRAAALDKERASGKPMGKLHGVVTGLKDVLSHKDHKLSASSRILDGFTAIYNATAVERLLQEEAIVIGRQNCDEFAMGSSNENSAFGPVKNALDETRVPGGSSGGSAVSIQAGLCMISLGSDTGGSVRQPADFCGVLGLKPSYGRVSRYGLIAYASSFDQVGIFGRSVDDLALVLEVIAGADEFDSTVSQQPVPKYSQQLSDDQKTYRIAYFSEALENPGLDPQIKAQTEAFIKRLTALGYTVEAVDFQLLDYIIPTYYILTTAEASSNLSRFDGVKFGFRAAEKNADLTELYKATRSQGFGKEVQRRILLGTFVLSAGYFDAYFTKAQQVRRLLMDKANELFGKYDFIISPTVPATAFSLGEKTNDPVEMFLADIYTVFANLVGIPGISLPIFRHPNGLPFGLQVMSSQYNELSLLRLSKKFMLIAN